MPAAIRHIEYITRKTFSEAGARTEHVHIPFAPLLLCVFSRGHKAGAAKQKILRPFQSIFQFFICRHADRKTDARRILTLQPLQQRLRHLAFLHRKATQTGAALAADTAVG